MPAVEILFYRKVPPSHDLGVAHMSLWKQYLQPDSVEQALSMLDQSQGSTRVIGGGTDLLLEMQQGRSPTVETLVDVTGIKELKEIRIEDDSIFIGAGVVHRRIVEHPDLQQYAQCLTEACGLIGGPQVRNVATIGGNVAHALPAGDGTIALVTMDARALLAHGSERSWKPIRELYAGPGRPSFDPADTLVVGFQIPRTRRGEGSAFRRIMRPQGVAIAILNMGVWVRSADSGMIDAIRIGVGPAGPTPLRAEKTEALLTGRVWNEDAQKEAHECLLQEASLRTSRHRATKEYRQHLVGVLLNRTVTEAIRRSK